LITETRGWILRHSPARSTGHPFKVCAARAAEAGIGGVGGAALTAASRQRRNIATRFPRDVVFDNFPGILSDFILPVSTECGQRCQRPAESNTASAAIAALSSHFCMPISTRVPPASGVTLIVNAADSPVRSRNVLDFRACTTVVDENVHSLHFIVLIKNITKLSDQFGDIGFHAGIISAVH
jgi:hypothetical protein